MLESSDSMIIYEKEKKTHEIRNNPKGIKNKKQAKLFCL